ncbi:MAG: hypothetical protein WB041_10115 [Pseudolabrys sp.]
MTESWGESLYRAAAYIAAMVALLAMVNFIANFSESEPIVPLPAVALAVIVWLTGVGCRAVLGARKAERLRHNMKQVIL